MNAQEQFWAGEFGNAYNKRSPGSVEANTVFFARALARAEFIGSAIEFGAGVGNNLRALHNLYRKASLAAVEINEDAAAHLPTDIDRFQVWRESILNCSNTHEYDLAFTKTLLIHIAPDDLPRAYDVLYKASARYVLVCEYYNPTPVEVEYRGHSGRLWKRDFAGEMLHRYANLRLVDYGFVYRRDPFTQDDVTYFLLEKRN